MEFSISKQNLVKLLGPVSAIADQKTAIPILSTVLVQAEGETLQATATDLYRTRVCVAEAAVTKPGAAALPGKKLHEIARNLPNAMVDVCVRDETTGIRCGKVKYTIQAMPASEFPPTPQCVDGETTTVPASILSSLVGMVRHAMCDNESRPHLHGALFEGADQVLRLVSTDGHRLCRAESVVEAKGMNFRHLVPYKGVDELRKMMDESEQVKFAFRSTHMFVWSGRSLLVIKLTGGDDYPPYSRLLAVPTSASLVVDRASLFDALKRVALVAEGTNSGVGLTVEPGVLKIFASTTVGTGTEEIEVELDGAPITVGFNAGYLMEALSALSENRVVIKLGDEKSPAIIAPVEGCDFVEAVMPMHM